MIYFICAGQKLKGENDSLISYAAGIIKEGDIIFRNGNSKESELIRSFAIKDSSFSHCGIVLKSTSNKLMVYHMLGGETVNGTDLHEESFNSFIKDSENDALGIYRYALTHSEIEIFKQYIYKLIAAKVRFDYQFSHLSEDRLYCTELIVRGFQKATKGIVNIELFTLDISKRPVRYWLKNDLFSYYPIEFLQKNRFVKNFWIYSFKK
jgi:hypothetical protein